MGDKKSFVSVPVTTWVFSSVTFIEKWNPISNYTLFVTVSMFQVVRFPNDACDSDDNSKNGTCKLILYLIDFVHYWNWIHLLCCRLYQRRMLRAWWYWKWNMCKWIWSLLYKWVFVLNTRTKMNWSFIFISFSDTIHCGDTTKEVCKIDKWITHHILWFHWAYLRTQHTLKVKMSRMEIVRWRFANQKRVFVKLGTCIILWNKGFTVYL